MAKISLTGTMFVGKTTLLNDLKQKTLPQVTYIPEVAFDLITRHPNLVREPVFQDLMFEEQVKREVEGERKSKVIICDRGVVDIIAHSYLFGHPIKPEWIDWLKTYEKTFIFRKEDIPFSNEVLFAERPFFDASVDWVNYRNELDNLMWRVIREQDLPHAVIFGERSHRTLLLEREINFHHTTVEGQQSSKERR